MPNFWFKVLANSLKSPAAKSFFWRNRADVSARYGFLYKPKFPPKGFFGRNRRKAFSPKGSFDRKENNSPLLGFFRPKSRRLFRKWRAYSPNKKVALGDARVSRGKSPGLRISVRDAHTPDIGFRQARCLGRKIKLQDANQNSIGRRLFPCILLCAAVCFAFSSSLPRFFLNGDKRRARRQ